MSAPRTRLRKLKKGALRRQHRQTAEALRCSEEWFRALTENAMDILTVLDRDGVFRYSSPSIQRILGYAPDELAGRSAFEFLHPEDRERVRQIFVDSVAVAETTAVVELRFRHKEGSWRTLEVIGKNLCGNPHINGVVLNSRDVTAQRHDAARLRLQSSALSAAANAIVITDRAGRIEWVNPAFTRVTGYAFDEVVGQNPRLLKSGRHDESFYRDLWQTVVAGRTWHGEMLNRRKDGTLYAEEMSITPVCDEAGAIQHFIAIKQDVTTRREAIEQIRQQAQLLNLARDAIIVRDLDDRVRFWNKGAERTYGWAVEEALGRSIDDLITGDLIATAKAKAQLLREQEWSGELRARSKAGRDLVVVSRWTLLTDERDQPRSVLMIDSDVTEEKALEAQFLRVQRLESIGTLASGIAHDLNNILAPILMAAQIIGQKAVDDETRKLVETIETSAQRGADVVKQVLTFARGVQGERVPLQPRHLVNELAKILRETFPRSITIRTEAPRHLWSILGDATQLHQVLLNLCVNARDALPNGGSLSIHAENVTIDEHYASMRPGVTPGSYVALRVQDTGTGIPPEVVDHIFDPFFTTKEQGKGTGLGLSTALGIVKSHGGSLDVQTELGKGTTFHVLLPAVRAATANGNGDAHPALPQGNGESILVIDDEAGIREVSRHLLTRNGYRVLLAADGTEALAVFAQHRHEIKAVLTDLMMPFMDGVATIRALRQLAPAVPVIASSGLGQTEKADELAALNVRTFLGKPYNAESLLSELARLLHEQREPNAKELQ